MKGFATFGWTTCICLAKPIDHKQKIKKLSTRACLGVIKMVSYTERGEAIRPVVAKPGW